MLIRALALVAFLALGGCVTATETNRPASACADLVPSAWTKGVAHAEFPAPTATQGDWVAYASDESANLDVANERESQTVEIVSRCQAHDDALVRSLTHKSWWPF